MASIALPRTNTSFTLSRRDVTARSSGATTSRLALLTNHDVAIQPPNSTEPGIEIVVIWEANSQESSIPGWVMPTAKAFADMLALPLGWNSYSARPVDPRTIEVAGGLLAAVMAHHTAPPTVVPTVRGGIQLEWHRNGIDLEIRFDPSRPTTVYGINNGTGEELECEWLPCDMSLSHWIEKL
jgi:hypothetical protein